MMALYHSAHCLASAITAGTQDPTSQLASHGALDGLQSTVGWDTCQLYECSISKEPHVDCVQNPDHLYAELLQQHDAMNKSLSLSATSQIYCRRGKSESVMTS